MPPITSHTLHVHVTGFGPFGQYEVNPSWEAVKRLEGQHLVEKPTWPLPRQLQQQVDDAESEYPFGSGQHHNGHPAMTLNLTTSQIPVMYSAAPPLVKAIHTVHRVSSSAIGDSSLALESANTSSSASLSPPPPPDLVIHVGVGLPHALKLEQRGRRWGYEKPGSDGKLAPREESRVTSPPPAEGGGHRRGLVGAEWDSVADELQTRVRTRRVVESLRAQGLKIDQSNDAGLYLCEFTFYTSLATAELNASGTTGHEPVPVQFVHVPPIGEPYSVEELSQALRLIIWTIASEGTGGRLQ